jgi:hypothetical protein
LPRRKKKYHALGVGTSPRATAPIFSPRLASEYRPAIRCSGSEYDSPLCS